MLGVPLAAGAITVVPPFSLAVWHVSGSFGVRIHPLHGPINIVPRRLSNFCLPGARLKKFRNRYHLTGGVKCSGRKSV
jgi:hypothetical protein